MYLIVFVFVLATSTFIVNKAEAAVDFPEGCSSALGYSITTGHPCNGRTSATMSIPGCTTALGYSITTGTPCSGDTEAISYLGGCDSIYNYSIDTGAPCNGTAVATIYQNTSPGVPGLPTTGTGGTNFINIFLLLSLGLLTVGGAMYTLSPSRAK